MKQKIFVLLAAFALSWTMALAQPKERERLDTMTVSYEGSRFRVVDFEHVMQTRLAYNWYVGAQVGIAHSWGSYLNDLSFAKRLNPTFGLSVGKEITPISEIRAQVMFARNSGRWNSPYSSDPDEAALGNFTANYNFNSAGLYLTYMPNLTNIFFGHMERRLYNFKGIIGLGVESSWGYNDIPSAFDTETKGMAFADQKNINSPFSYRHTLFADCLVALQLGVGVSVRLNDVLKFTAEITENILDDSFDKNTNEDRIWDGRLNLQCGVTWHLGSTPERRHFTFVRKDEPQMQKLQQQINTQRRRADQLKRTQRTVYDTVYVKRNVIYTLIAFDSHSDVVDRLQQTNVFTAARILESYPQSHIYITNSSKAEDEMFNKRANAIKKILQERYSVPDDKVVFFAREKDALLATHKDETYIIFIVND